MKKLFLAIAAVAMVFATSCKKENANEPEVPAGDNEFICVIDQNSNPQNAPAVSDNMGTLAHIDGNNNVWWQEGDVIMYHGNENTLGAGYYPLTCSKQQSDGRAYFSANGMHFGQGTHRAYYPSTLYNGSNLVLPSSITIDPDKNAAQLPMFGYGNGSHYLTFRNICAVLKITIPNSATCNKIELHADNNICGAFTVADESTDEPYADLNDKTSSNDNTITVNANANFTAGSVIYVAIPAGTYTNFYFKLLNGSTLISESPKQDINVEVNKVYPVGLATQDYFCFTAQAATTISMINDWSSDPSPYLEYCKYTSSTGQYGNWTAFISPSESVSTSVTLAEGDRLYLRAGDGTSNTRTNTSMNSRRFTSTGNVEVSGNIMYLLNGTNPPTDFGSTDQVFENLFWEMLYLTSAKNLLLPATTLTSECYQNMFYSCTSLTTAPALKATTLAESCYASMFSDCFALSTVPALDATTLAEGCCEQMFANCTTLTTVPALKAKTLENYCYQNMFSGCSSLTSVTMLAEYDEYTWPNEFDNYLSDWLSDVGTSGTIYVLGTDEQTSFANANEGIKPDGWTVTVYQQQQPIRRK